MFSDVLQRTRLAIDRGIRYLSVTSDGIPYDLLFLYGSHSIWRSRMDIRRNDTNARSVSTVIPRYNEASGAVKNFVISGILI